MLAFVRTAPDEEISKSFKVVFGSGGLPAYFNRLAVLVREKSPEFSPEGLDEYLRQTDAARRQRADEQIRIIQMKVPEFVVERLKEFYYGPEFLARAVKNQEILVDAFKTRTQTPITDQGPLETYLDFLDFRKIIETGENWPHFKEELSI